MLGGSLTRNSLLHVRVYCVDEGVYRLRQLGVPYTTTEAMMGGTSLEICIFF